MRLLLKTLVMIAMAVIILIPLMMIRGTIHEREGYRDQAVEKVASSSAGAQSLSGAVVVVPYTQLVEVEEKDNAGNVTGKVLREKAEHWVFFPTTSTTRGTIRPESKFLGLYEVRSYEFGGETVADFRIEIPTDDNPARPRRIGRPWLEYGIADVRGLAGVPKLWVGKQEMVLERGLGAGDGSGLHAVLPQTLQAGQRLTLSTRFTFALKGTESLQIAPLAENTRIVLDSAWRHPQFNGDFLPRQRRIDDKGFHAEWEVSALATNAQAQYLAGATLPGQAARAPDGVVSPSASGLDAIGVSLVDPVDIYALTDRASKYGILFVALTFIGFFMFEMIRQLRIHPIQYGLVGFALALFFLLLLAMSEHVDFAIAYLVASIGCVGLIGYYVSHVLGSWLRGIGFTAMLTTLYAVLYGLLISEDNAMVLGAGLLFLILAVIMVVTRRIDWYSVNANAAQPAPRATAGVVPPPMP